MPNFFADRDLTANISRIDFCHLAYKMLEQKSLISEHNVKSSFADTDDKEVTFLANSGIITDVLKRNLHRMTILRVRRRQ